MLNTIKYTLADLVRLPGIIIWSLAFPIILMSVFSMMFGPLDDMSDFDPIRIAVVEAEGDTEAAGANAEASTPAGETVAANVPAAEAAAANAPAVSEEEAFASFMEAVSTGDDRLFDVETAPSAQAAEELVLNSRDTDDALIGYVQLADGKPEVHIADDLSANAMDYTEASILTTAMDEYTSKAQLLKDIMAENPTALANQRVLDSLQDTLSATQVVDVTRNQPKESVRYYFALLGMAALFGGSVSLTAFQRMRPNISALGARRAVGGLSHGKAVAATLIACWIMNFACLTIAYLFMRYVIGIDFGGRDLACLGVTATASLTALSLGCAVSAIPKMPESAKSGLLTGIVCFASLFAGLYGQPTMELADMVAANAPWAAWINPAAQISQAFYSVMYYDSLVPLLTHVGALLIMAAVLFALSVGSLRRQRYASI